MTPDADANAPLRIVVFSGAGGGVPDLRAFAETPADFARFAPLTYPGLRRYLDEDFSAEALIGNLTDEVVQTIGEGPLGILGVSLGGHVGYAVALKLASRGIKVAGLCVVDSFIFASTDIRPGSADRYFKRILTLTRRGSVSNLWRLIRSLFWRALVRLASGHAIPWLRRWRDNVVFRAVLRIDPMLEKELRMRLLLRNTAPWLAALDRSPRPLAVPAAHLRLSSAADSDIAWRARCPNIEIIEIAGDHDGLLDPANFAQLRRAFDLATRGWGAPLIRIDA